MTLTPDRRSSKQRKHARAVQRRGGRARPAVGSEQLALSFDSSVLDSTEPNSNDAEPTVIDAASIDSSESGSSPAQRRPEPADPVEIHDRSDNAGTPVEESNRPQLSNRPESPAAGQSSQVDSVDTPSPSNLRQQLEAAGLNLSGHPLAQRFDEMKALPLGDGSSTKVTRNLRDRSTVSANVNSDEITSPDSRPLLNAQAWSELTKFAPEVTSSIELLETLVGELRVFERPMGPEEAMTLVHGLETISRLIEMLSVVSLSVFERVGTPTDFGAKSTKALVQDRLQLSPQEAIRRTELAKNLGNRVDMTGQSMQPVCPVVADGLHRGTLSAAQVAVINECMQKLPSWVSAEVRAQTEQRLVDHAPEVRVSDLRVIFKRILDEIDPDGEEPKDPSDRSMYRVNLRVRTNGDWDLSGLLDPVSGGVLNGLLTSRIQSAGPVAGDESTSASHEMIELFTEVLSGDRHDARVPHPAGFAEVDGTVGGDGNAKDDGKALVGPIGVGTDGVAIDLSAEQPTVRNRIYERFASLVSKIDMTRTVTGAPYALVVTAKAEDLAERRGEGKSGTEDPVPIRELSGTGLNGAVFFHLMSGKAKTVQVVTEKRFANAKQLAVLTARDQGCTFPGCDTPPGWCDVHHIVPWSEGGRTDVNNLTLACGAHHHLIDRSDWYAVMLRDGRPAWVPPGVVDPARKPLLHARFIATEIIDALFDDSPEDDSPEDDSPDDDSGDNDGT